MQRITWRHLADEVLVQLAHGRVAFLVGAGISMLPPSRLLSGNALKQSALEGIGNQRGCRRYARVLAHAPEFQRLVPEILFQRCYDWMGDRLFPFFDVLRGTRANIAHRVLANFCHRRATPILTTNFDTLIERSHKAVEVMHLHGHLGEPQEMVVRIFQVGRGIAPHIEHRAHAILRKRNVCVLGYSGNDEDVRLLVKRCSPRKVWWLVRDDSPRALANPLRFETANSLAIARGDLTTLFRYWSTSCRLKARAGHAHRRSRQRSSSWAKSLQSFERFGIISDLFEDVGEYRIAATVAERGFRECPASGPRSWFKVQAADAYRTIGRTRDALRVAKEAVRLAELSKDPWNIAGARNALGLVYLEQHKPDRRTATMHLTRAASAVAQRMRLKANEPLAGQIRAFAARVFNNLGLAEKNIPVARRAYMRSIRLKRQLGDLVGLATTSANLAVLHARAGNAFSAARWGRRAFYLIDRYDLQYRRAYLLRELGVASCRQHKTAAGLKQLEEALRIYKDLIGDELGVRLTQEAIRRYLPR